MLRLIAHSVVAALDDRLSRLELALAGDPPGIVSLLFHSIIGSADSDRAAEVLDPAQTVTTESLDGLIAYFSSHGYEFVSPADLSRGLAPDGRYVLLTFDDGYFNNFHALPVLGRHRVPATFFISTNHILTGRSFWWDVVYRLRRREGRSLDSVHVEVNGMKHWRHDRIEAWLSATFGDDAMQPVGVYDRPMTPSELMAFSRHPLVHLGNHTSDHGILTNYAGEALDAQIRDAQELILELTGVRPLMLAYPNGNHSAEVTDAAIRCGLAFGITLDEKRIRLPLADADRFRLGRFLPPQGAMDVRALRALRSRISIRRIVRQRGLTRYLPGWGA